MNSLTSFCLLDETMAAMAISGRLSRGAREPLLLGSRARFNEVFTFSEDMAATLLNNLETLLRILTRLFCRREILNFVKFCRHKLPGVKCVSVTLFFLLAQEIVFLI